MASVAELASLPVAGVDVAAMLVGANAAALVDVGLVVAAPSSKVGARPTDACSVGPDRVPTWPSTLVATSAAATSKISRNGSHGGNQRGRADRVPRSAPWTPEMVERRPQRGVSASSASATSRSLGCTCGVLTSAAQRRDLLLELGPLCLGFCRELLGSLLGFHLDVERALTRILEDGVDLALPFGEQLQAFLQ